MATSSVMTTKPSAGHEKGPVKRRPFLKRGTGLSRFAPKKQPDNQEQDSFDGKTTQSNSQVRYPKSVDQSPAYTNDLLVKCVIMI